MLGPKGRFEEWGATISHEGGGDGRPQRGRLVPMRLARDAYMTTIRRADQCRERERVAGKCREASEWGVAARPHRGEEGTLGFGAGAGIGVVERRAESDCLGIVRAHFDGEDTLCDGGQHDVWFESLGDDVRPSEAFEAGGGEDNRIVLASVELGEARIDVAANIEANDIGACGLELAGAPW
jgi:hypothetical protein